VVDLSAGRKETGGDFLRKQLALIASAVILWVIRLVDVVVRATSVRDVVVVLRTFAQPGFERAY
jgi:hypothetical protein